MNKAPQYTKRIEPIFHPVERGWYAEVFDGQGGLLHTTGIKADKEKAIAAAKEWLKSQDTKVVQG